MSKNFFQYLPKLTEREYRDLDMLHYTLLSNFAKSNIAAFHDKESDIEAFRFGNIVDTILTHREDFENLFYVSSNTKPLTPSQEQVISALINAYSATYQYLCDIPDENIIDIARVLKVYKNYGDDALLAAIKKDECSAEYECRVKSLGKTVITKGMLDDAQSRIAELLEDPKAEILFSDNTDPDIEILYQPKFIDEDENLKAMIDVLFINHKNKLVRPYDIKTSSMNSYDFNKAFIKFRYDIQADLYSYLINKFIAVHKEFNDYKVLPFTFIVLAPDGHVFAEYNPEESIDSDFYKTNMNWRQLYDRIMWHKKTGIIYVTKEIHDNNGILKLKL